MTPLQSQQKNRTRRFNVADFRAIVRHYRAEHQESASNELRFFKIQRSFGDAVRKAALAQRPDGKRFRHQNRIPGSALKIAELRLRNVVPSLEQAPTFAHLFAIVHLAINDVYKIGELAVYDSSLRIAAWRGLEPESVYMHAGTRVGARALGLNTRRISIPLAELPVTLSRLPAREIEDILCIYKDVLSGRRAVPSNTRCS